MAGNQTCDLPARKSNVLANWIWILWNFFSKLDSSIEHQNIASTTTVPAAAAATTTTTTTTTSRFSTKEQHNVHKSARDILHWWIRPWMAWLTAEWSWSSWVELISCRCQWLRLRPGIPELLASRSRRISSRTRYLVLWLSTKSFKSGVQVQKLHF